MIMRVFVVLALLRAVVASPRTGGKRLPSRIVGGDATTILQYPFTSNMEHYWFMWWFQTCGGTLITSASVLSAAHCYFGEHPSYWRVRLGSTSATQGGSLHQVSRIVFHPEYNHNRLQNDVAIVRLAVPVVFSASIGVARIAGTNYNLPDGTLVTSLGWGTLWQNGPSSDVLQRVDTNIINQQLCAERYAFLKTQPGFSSLPDIDAGMLCAGILDVGGKDTCQGDSGGPMVHGRDVVVGITSWAHGCGHELYPGVNARVSHYANWIAENGSA